MKILRTAGLGSNFTGSYKKRDKKPRHSFIQKLYFGFFQTFQDEKKMR